MDVPVLSDLCTSFMEKTASKLELISRYFTDFSPLQWQQLSALDDLYKEWNSRINLISRKDIDDLYERHVLHSLSIAAVFEFKKGDEVIDIGTGGGFPGIPLAIFFPDAHFHLVDSIGKKIKVVDAIAGSLGLTNISTQQIRVEEIRGRKFDCAVSRAVAPLKELWTWSKPLLRKKGNEPIAAEEKKINDAENRKQAAVNGLICLKGGDLSREMAESGSRPNTLEIYNIFPEKYFREKFIVFVPFATAKKR
jgi:16S rRNA (guanine527-N7)-methyltransferase